MFPIIPLVGALLPTVVNAIRNSFTPSAPPAGKEDFLKLLASQLENQQAPSTASSNDIVGSPAALANVGGSPGMLAGTYGGPGVATGALLGRPVTAVAARFDYADGPVSLPYALGAPVGNALLELTDTSGTIVARIPLGPKTAGPHSFDFSGRTLGRALPAGQYRYRILAPDATGNFTALPAISGTVSSVRFERGAPVLALGSRKVMLADLTMVGGAGL